MSAEDTQTLLLGSSDLDHAVAILRSGGLVAFPTETVYGLGADAEDGAAVAKIYEAKQRPAGHPLIVHVASAAAAWTWVSETPVPDAALALADAFWPGPLTMILPRSPRAHPDVVGGRDSIGLRVPDHPLTLELLTRFGGGLAGPSANRFGHVSPTVAAHVVDDLGGRIDAVLDGGPARVGVESTIVEVINGGVTLLRPGGVMVGEIDAALDLAGLAHRVVDGRTGESRAAGMLASHYAPSAPVLVVNRLGDTKLAEGDVIVGSQELAGTTEASIVELPADAEGFAERLYAALREADEICDGRIVVVRPQEGRLLAAVDDRLNKASTR